MKKIALAVALAASLSGCITLKVQVPENVKVVETDNGGGVKTYDVTPATK